MPEKIVFVFASACMLAAAVKVVTTRNLVHMVLWLGLTLAATAVLFVVLQAPFLAAIQLMLYTGGLLTLMLFGVMLTQRDEGFLVVPNPSHRPLLGSALGLSAFVMLATAIAKTETLPHTPSEPVTTQALGALLFTEHALSFEVLALLLLAVTLGAIVFARRGDAGSEQERRAHIIAPRKSLPAPADLAGKEPGI